MARKIMLGNNSGLQKRPKITFVTGKGGVGKSTVAAVVATREALAGSRVLLVELGERSYFSDATGVAIGYEAAALNSWGVSLKASLYDGPKCLREFISFYVPVEKLVDLFFENKIMQALVRAAPALKELSILGKITSGNRAVGPDMPFDHIVVDAFSTGHFQTLFRVPSGMNQVIRFGPMGEQSRGIQRVLRDSDITSVKIVCYSEELPVQEALELNAWLLNEGQIQPEIVVNRWIELSDEILTSQHSETGSSDFLKYLKGIAERQNDLIRRFTQAKNINWQKMPFSFAVDFNTRVIELAGKK